ncbi:hypothetical protein KBJ94_23055 [Pseudomonas sp. ITA]|uniref:hypothetical protein n=1 Tax=Pseudomonas sp. ITA TaxID=2825841 RepID=UPI0024999B51|nr:hypothetical protein [Pseudomonas sp. ITA]MDI2144931.1 hypothetical protein [Pseudomonas sp. ITA]
MNTQSTLIGNERLDLLKSAAPSPLDLLKVAVDAGLSFADCENYFGVDSSTNPFANAARAIYAERSDNEIEICERTVISRCEYGAFVGARVFVRDEQAGLPGIVELFDGLVQHYFDKFEPGFAQNCPVLHAQIAMLEDLSTDYGEELGSLSGKPPESIPKARFVFAGLVEENYASEIIRNLVHQGETSGFDPDKSEAIRNWLEHNDRLLDAQLTAVLMNPKKTFRRFLSRSVNTR